MNAIAYIALFAWPIVAIALASWLRVPRAAIVSCIAAWLFLPEGGLNFPGPLDLSKINVTTLSMLMGLLLMDSRKVMSIRWSPIDIPIAIVCISSFFSSLANGLGAYDGLAESLAKTFSWGVPWVVGRACFTSLADLRALAIGIVLGGLVYVPFCLYEARMSPQLHRIVYGFFPHDEFAQTRRFGGFRPNVFMQHGLMVGMWMCMAALVGAWMWLGGRTKALRGVPMWLIVGAQTATAVICKSAGAIVLMGLGGAVLAFSRITRTRLALLAIAALPLAYVAYRVMDGPTSAFIDAVAAVPVLSERVDSLDYRLEAEGILMDHALKRPIFGWGGYGRHRPLNEAGEELARTDSLWVIMLGQNGVVGVAAVYLALALPLWKVARRVPAGALLSPQAAPLLVLSLMVALFACDSLFNAMFNPVYVMAGGGVLTTLHAMQRAARKPALRGPTGQGPDNRRGPAPRRDPLAAASREPALSIATLRPTGTQAADITPSMRAAPNPIPITRFHTGR